MYEYDIAVREPEMGKLLAVVEVREELPHDDPTWQDDMANFMVGSACGYGLIVTPSEVWVLRNRFQSDSPESIEIAARVGASDFFDHPGGPGMDMPTNRDTLVRFVAEWLRRMATNWFRALLDRPDHPGADIIHALVPGFVGAVTDAVVCVREAEDQGRTESEVGR